MSYIAYGINIDSFLPLPEFLPGGESIDVVIRKGTVNNRATTDSVETGASANQKVSLYRRNVGTFLVQGGREVIVDPVPGVEEGFLRLFILGPVIGILLHQRGYFTLHASTVSIDGAAVAFLGRKGEGKSTLAAALHQRGHRVISDDVTAVQVRQKSATVFPGFPQLKLLPEAVTSLGSTPNQFHSFHSRSQKRAYPVTHKFLQTPLPLMRIYVLEEGLQRQIQPIPSRDALTEVTRHAYTAHLQHSFALRLLGAKEPASLHFNHCVSLVNCVPVYRFARPRSLLELPDVARFVETDMKKQSFEEGRNNHETPDPR